MFGIAKMMAMQSENTSKTTRKTAKPKTLEIVDAVNAEVVKKARPTKSSPTKSSASKKSEAFPKHHRSATTDKVKTGKHVAPAETALETLHVANEPTNAEPDRREVGYDDIARLAHTFWASRNYAHGSANEDWLRAEKELAFKSDR